MSPEAGPGPRPRGLGETRHSRFQGPPGLLSAGRDQSQASAPARGQGAPSRLHSGSDCGSGMCVSPRCPVMQTLLVPPLESSVVPVSTAQCPRARFPALCQALRCNWQTLPIRGPPQSVLNMVSAAGRPAVCGASVGPHHLPANRVFTGISQTRGTERHTH